MSTSGMNECPITIMKYDHKHRVFHVTCECTVHHSGDYSFLVEKIYVRLRLFIFYLYEKEREPLCESVVHQTTVIIFNFILRLALMCGL